MVRNDIFIPVNILVSKIIMDSFHRRRNNRKEESVFLSTPDIYFQSQQDLPTLTGNETKDKSLKVICLPKQVLCLQIKYINQTRGLY